MNRVDPEIKAPNTTARFKGMRDWEIRFKGMVSGTHGVVVVRGGSVEEALSRFYETFNKVAVAITYISDGSTEA